MNFSIFLNQRLLKAPHGAVAIFFFFFLGSGGDGFCLLAFKRAQVPLIFGRATARAPAFHQIASNFFTLLGKWQFNPIAFAQLGDYWRCSKLQIIYLFIFGFDLKIYPITIKFKRWIQLLATIFKRWIQLPYIVHILSNHGPCMVFSN